MEKEIVEVKDQVSKMDQAIASLPAKITNQDEYDATYDVGKKVGTLLKNIDKQEKAITKPINDSLKKIRDMFRPFKTQVTGSVTILKSDVRRGSMLRLKRRRSRRSVSLSE